MTKTIIAATIFALGVATASTAPAQPPKMTMPMPRAAAKTGTGVGVVTAIDTKARTVTIRHEPIAAIGWPAMTMSFKARAPAVMQAAKVGQSVAFGVRVSGADAEVTAIKPR